MASLASPHPFPPPASARREQLAEVLVRITADRGLAAVTVREVAAAAGLSIGAVQYYFATKDEMLAFAFQHVVDRTWRRVGGLTRTGREVDDVTAVLEELLPLDDTRRDEAKVYVAFAAGACFATDLQVIQRTLLAEIRRELEHVLGPTRAGHAVLLMAVVDGMVFQEVSAPGSVGSAGMVQTLRTAVRTAFQE